MPPVRIDLAVYADTPWPSPTVMQSVLVAVAASNGGHHPKVNRSMFSQPAMGGRHFLTLSVSYRFQILSLIIKHLQEYLGDIG